MDFTREPIIETVITPREGCKIVVRSSKASGQEEFFVDALEVVSFGHSQFFRSLEKPKPFLVPTSDYEVLEVREARMVLKSVGIDRSIKIGGGKETVPRAPKEREKEKERERERERPAPQPVEEPTQVLEPAKAASDEPGAGTDERNDPRFERRRDRRRHYRRRRGREEGDAKEEEEGSLSSSEGEKAVKSQSFTGEEGEQGTSITLEPPRASGNAGHQPTAAEAQAITNSVFSSLLAPPPNLISETIALYRENEKFKGAFYPKEQRTDRRKEEVKLEEETVDSIIERHELPSISHEPVTFHLEQSEQVTAVEESIYVPSEAHTMTPELFVEEQVPMDPPFEPDQELPVTPGQEEQMIQEP